GRIVGDECERSAVGVNGSTKQDAAASLQGQGPAIPPGVNNQRRVDNNVVTCLQHHGSARIQSPGHERRRNTERLCSSRGKGKVAWVGNAHRDSTGYQRQQRPIVWVRAGIGRDEQAANETVL